MFQVHDPRSGRSCGGGFRSIRLFALLGLGVTIGPGWVEAQSRDAGLATPRAPEVSPAKRLHEVWREPITAVTTVRVLEGPPAAAAEAPSRRTHDQAVWVDGYWDYDTSSSRYVWVSGTWRVPPAGRAWVNGSWTRDERGWYRVAGFWTASPNSPYRLDGPPGELSGQDRGPRPSPRHLWVAGQYVPKGDTLVWRPGFWSKHQPGWTWIPDAWLQRPRGWVFQEGFWLNDADLRAACDRLFEGRSVAGPARPFPSQLGGPVTDTAALLRDWARESSPGVEVPIGRSIGGEVVQGTMRYGTARPFLPPGGYENPAIGGTGPASTLPRGPSQGYYVGNEAPGTTFRSYSTTPSGSPPRSVYVGSTLPGTSYPSYELTPSALPGASRYAGNDVPGTTYRSYLPGSVDSIGNYGYGTTAPGSTAGQLGGTTP